ncbi:MAG: FG-GAP-like repeat-containing protein [Planctomycetota bacterium]
MNFFRQLAVLLALSSALGACGWVLMTAHESARERAPLDLPPAYADAQIEFYGVGICGPDFVWCLDRSCSMGWGGWFATVKSELITTLQQLSPGSRFSIVSFASDVTSWSPDLQVATPTMISDGTTFLDSQSPGGNGCVISGLGAAINIAEQSTQAASIIVIGDSPQWTCSLSDTTTDLEALAQIVALNTQSIPIHCFHTGPDDLAVGFFELLSTEFGGVFVDLASSAPVPTSATVSGPFIRGDVNLDGTVDVSDIVGSLATLFQGSAADCVDAVDANDDGAIDVSDPVYTLQHLFSPTGTPPPAPYPACGFDSTCDALRCEGSSLACTNPTFFGGTTVLSAPESPTDAISADFDENGEPDLAVCGSGSVQIYLSGSGTLMPGQTVSTSGVNEHLETGDFNGDGFVDIVVIGNNPVIGGLGELHVLTGVGNGTFTSTTTVLSAGTRWIDVADVDTDGVLDVVTSSTNTESVMIRLGTGSGTFLPATAFSGLPEPTRLLFCNVNNDGAVDLVVLEAAGNDAHIFIGDGAGGFASPIVRSLSPLGVRGLAIDDVTGDGNSDLVTYFQGPGAMSVYAGGGTGGFSLIDQFPADPQTVDLVVADFDLDGDLDTTTVGEFSISLFENLGSGALVDQGSFDPLGATNLSFVRALDIDGDGDLDLVTALDSNSVQIMENSFVP